MTEVDGCGKGAAAAAVSWALPNRVSALNPRECGGRGVSGTQPFGGGAEAGFEIGFGEPSQSSEA